MWHITAKGDTMVRKSKKYKIVLPALMILVSLGTVTKAYADEVKYTTTANLNMRTEAGTNNRIILTIPKGQQIIYVASNNGWYQVSYGGKGGYVSSAFVNKTQVKVTEPVSSGTSISQTGQVITTGTLNFRTGPDKTYSKVGTLPRNTTVSYSEVKNGWYLITYNGKTGYASGRYLSVLSQPTEAPSVPVAQEGSPTAPVESTGVKRYYTTSPLNMRTGPSTGYGIVQVLPSGAELTYLGQDGWYHVSYNGKTGYASNRFVRVVEEVATDPVPLPESIITPVETPVEIPVEAPVVVETPSEQIPASVQEVTGILKKTELLYTTTTLNMRTGPGVGNKLLLTLPKGVHLTSLGVENGWHKVSYKGQTGFASGKYLAVNSVYTVDGTIIVNKGLVLPSSFSPGENPEAKAAFNQMNKAAKKAGITLNLFSGYRSYSYQQSLFNKYVKQDGVSTAETYSARPGYSEHQTGLTFDIGGKDSSKWVSSKFGDTTEGKWLAENASGYGFILRYPKGKEQITGYTYEPWHFRYLGVDLARKVTGSGLTLDEYFSVVYPDYK